MIPLSEFLIFFPETNKDTFFQDVDEIDSMCALSPQDYALIMTIEKCEQVKESQSLMTNSERTVNTPRKPACQNNAQNSEKKVKNCKKKRTRVMSEQDIMTFEAYLIQRKWNRNVITTIVDELSSQGIFWNVIARKIQKDFPKKNVETIRSNLKDAKYKCFKLKV